MQDSLVLVRQHELSEALVPIVREAVRKEVSGIMATIHQANQQSTKNQSDMLTRREVAKQLRVSLPTVDSWAKNGIIAPIRIGRRTLFRRDEILLHKGGK